MTEIKRQLQFLYGEDTATKFYPRLLDYLNEYRNEVKAQPPSQIHSAEVSQLDVLLITYGDQVRDGNAAPLETLNSFLTKRLADIISGVHILPFYPYSSDDGFAVIDWFAVDAALGTWKDVTALGKSFDLMFDGVLNHLSAGSEWFKGFLQDDPAYRDFFVTVYGNPDLSKVVRPRALPLLTEFQTASGPRKVWTTFSADQVDLNFKNPEVLLAAIRALLFYARHGARFIRLDAIAYLWKEIGTSCIHLPQTHEAIKLMRSVLNEAAPEVLLITETNVPHSDNISYFGNGLDEAQLVYNFALPPLVLHSLATGDASALSGWAKSLKLPSKKTAFFNFLASHDGIGVNPARGILDQPAIDALVKRATNHGGFVSYKHDTGGSKIPYELNINYFDALSDPNAAEQLETQIDRFMVAQSIMLALAGMPGIYFHSLFGSRNDRAGAETSGIPRRINRQKLELALLEQELNDPESLRVRVFSRYLQLLQTRRQHPAFAPSAPQQIIDLSQSVFALLRGDGADRVLCVHNVTNSPVKISLKLPDTSLKSHWSNLLTKKTFQSSKDSLEILLTPYQVFWAKPT